MSPTFDHAGDKTLPLAVANMGFMLDRLGQDCGPLQFLRELTQNSIEAILRNPDHIGTIHWDVDWNRFDLEGDGVYKLAIIDDGDGMTGPEMVKYINQLSSSISDQSIFGNYGIGAKISAATRNPYGLIYLSWKNGQGAMIHLWRDPDTNQYGLRQFEHPDGTFDYWLPIDEAVKPNVIANHGTMVVLLGKSADANTLRPPVEALSPSRWIAKYLNTRYFEFPAGIKVRAREGWEHPRSDADRNLLRTISGQKPYLDSHKLASGIVVLQGATAYWWVLVDEPALSQNSGFVNSSGHTAALYRGELYELETARGGVARLQQFGVIFGYKQVALYLEPHSVTGEDLTTNTARTQLLLNGEPLPWAEWAAEFRDHMPRDIQELIETVAAGSQSPDHSQSIRDRLKQIRELFRLTRYRPTPVGEALIDDEIRQGGDRSTLVRPRQTSTRSHPSGSKGGRAGDVYAVFASDKGTPATQVDADPYPKVHWVSSIDNTRSPGFLEDRAAKYLPEQNLLQVNADFRAFTDMATRYVKLYGNISGSDEIVREVVHEWFEQTLVETVLGVQALQGAREWSPSEIEKALSDEALTAAVMPRYHVDFAIKRALGSKLGSLREKAPAL